MRKTTWLLSATLLIGIVHCSSKKGDDESSKKGKPARPAPAKVDKEAVRKMLQGSWNIGNPDKPAETYLFKGDTAQVTMHNMIDSKTGKPHVYGGKLEIKGPNRFGIKTKDGTSYYFNYAKLEGNLHLSAGNIYRVANVDEFKVETRMGHSLSRKKGVCTWEKDFAGKKAVRKVKCPLQDKDGKKAIMYQTPSFFDKTKSTDNYLFVVGPYLVSEQMMKAKAHKAK